MSEELLSFQTQEIQPTPDSVVLKFKKHPRNTVLGASLLLESMLPELSPEKINELSIILAKEIDAEIKENKKK